MAGRLAVDFGTSNTVVAVWDEARREGLPYHLPEFGRLTQQEGQAVSTAPSLIHYSTDGHTWIGDQVLQRNLYHSNATFRWMKRYLLNRSPIKKEAGGRMRSYAEAGRDFLASLLVHTAGELDLRDEEIALTVPVEAFEHYENWLAQVAEAARLPRFRLLDEPSAAALGYGAHIQPGDVYLIFDFGGGTLNVAVVLVEPEEQAQAGQRCRMLGKAGQEIGGAVIDQWLFQEVLQRNQLSDADEAVRPLSSALLVECERAKERLSFDERAEVLVVNPDTGAALGAEFSRSQFEELLDGHAAYSQIDQTIRRAINAARERGYTEDDIKETLMVGGSSQIPSVRRTLQRIFGRDRVRLNRPLDAIARGAAAFIAGVDFYDHIQHDYAIRYLNRDRGDYEYRVLVPRGTPYPTREPLARLAIKATYDGQTQLGIAIFEMGARRPGDVQSRVELVFDPSGAARVLHLSPDEVEGRNLFWMNESNPTFLLADPPAQAGEPRFEVVFAVDGNKRLLITARDLQTGRLVLEAYPVVRLI
jgi:molecular chaperone DnaK